MENDLQQKKRIFYKRKYNKKYKGKCVKKKYIKIWIFLLQNDINTLYNLYYMIIVT